MNQFLETPSTNFARVRDGRQSLPLWMDIDLSASRSAGAGSALILNISGNSFFVDADTVNVGTANIHFQDTTLGISAAPFYVAPGFVAKVGFTQLMVENAAQPGKRLRIFYGVDIDFSAGVNASTISGTVNIGNLNSAPGNVSDLGAGYTGAYKSNTNLVANTPDTIFAPAANVNGAIIVRASHYSLSGAAHTSPVLIAKNAPPANVVDGIVIASAEYASGPSAGNIGMGYKLEKPIRVPAGLGLYTICSVNESLSLRSCLYTLL